MAFPPLPPPFLPPPASWESSGAWVGLCSMGPGGGGPVFTRSFYTYVGAPRAIGIRASYKFGE